MERVKGFIPRVLFFILLFSAETAGFYDSSKVERAEIYADIGMTSV